MTFYFKLMKVLEKSLLYFIYQAEFTLFNLFIINGTLQEKKL